MRGILICSAALLLVPAACHKASDASAAADRTKADPTSNYKAPAEMPQSPPAETQARAAAGASGDDAPYYTKLPLKEFMPHVMQYAGDGIWKHQGYINDKNGERSLFPKNDQEWDDAESGARTLAEVTNVLLIPGRRVPDPRWDKAVLEVRAVALKAADAAERHDQKTFFDVGGELDEACDTCHKQFDPTFQGPKGK